jgi:hypothetical protein
MATSRPIDASFLTGVPWVADLKKAGGFLQFQDGDLQYVVMLDSVQMRVFHRTKGELFETSVDNDMKAQAGLAITGCFMDNKTFGGIVMKVFVGAGGKNAAQPNLQAFAGVVIEKGSTISGNASEPEYAHLAFKDGPPSQILIDLGDPSPSSGIKEAYGALGANILKSVKIPSGTPVHKGVDRRYRDLQAQGDASGLPYVAISKRAKIVVAAVKPHGVNLSMDDVRDRFVTAGFDDVVFLDGGDSAYLNLLGTWIVRVGPYKNRITTFGTKFFYATPP